MDLFNKRVRCTAHVFADSTECSRFVPDDAPIRLCYEHALLVHDWVAALGGTAAVQVLAREDAADQQERAARFAAYQADLVRKVEAELSPEDRAVIDQRQAAVRDDPILSVNPADAWAEGIIDVSTRYSAATAFVAYAPPSQIVNLLMTFGLKVDTGRRDASY